METSYAPIFSIASLKNMRVHCKFTVYELCGICKTNGNFKHKVMNVKHPPLLSIFTEFIVFAHDYLVHFRSNRTMFLDV